MIFLQKCINNDYYNKGKMARENKNVLNMIFILKSHWKCLFFFLLKCLLLHELLSDFFIKLYRQVFDLTYEFYTRNITKYHQDLS